MISYCQERHDDEVIGSARKRICSLKSTPVVKLTQPKLLNRSSF